jgi:3-isopropylmalate/(R)-2-methylmalate dehydratase small subunit/methanogen homoaconitase small subunit
MTAAAADTPAWASPSHSPLGIIRGRAWLFGDDLNTDVIHPPDHYSLDSEVVRRGLFHKYDPTLQPSLVPGDVLVGGKNFGCGSSRETSIRSLKLNQIGAIVAVSFARIFFRNATNNGLPCLTFEDPADRDTLTALESLVLDPARAELATSSGHVVRLTPPGSFVLNIWQAGGLLGLLPR